MYGLIASALDAAPQREQRRHLLVAGVIDCLASLAVEPLCAVVLKIIQMRLSEAPRSEEFSTSVVRALVQTVRLACLHNCSLLEASNITHMH